MRALLLGISLIGAACIATACGTPSAASVDAAVTGPFVPGISGGALADRIEVIAVDELTREPIEATITVERRGLDSVSGSSPLVHDGAEPFDRADVLVVVGDRATRIRWMGVGGARVVIPVPRRETRRVEVDVRGATPSGTSSIELTTLAPLRIVRSGGVGGLSGSCPSGGACRVSLDAPAGASGLVATAIGAGGASLGFAIAELDSAAVDFDLTASAAVSIDAPLPAPGPGLDAVVGVPGVTAVRQLARLPAASGSSFVVPSLDGDLAGGSWWILARAQASDRSSTVVQRDLRDPSGAGAWPPFLEPPVLAQTPTLVTAAPPAGATLLVVERFDATGEDSTLYFEPPAEVEIEAASPSGHVDVRAIDAGAIDASRFDLDAIEATMVRWSESTRAW